MSMPEEEDAASGTDLRRGERINTYLELGLGLGFVELPTLPEPGAEDDEGHPEDR
jgi:hypothetical protein